MVNFKYLNNLRSNYLHNIKTESKFHFIIIIKTVCIVIVDSGINQQGRVRIPLTGLTLPHVCTCTKPGPGFLTSYVVVLFVFSEFS